jgi:hypothetical protein
VIDPDDGAMILVWAPESTIHYGDLTLEQKLAVEDHDPDMMWRHAKVVYEPPINGVWMIYVESRFDLIIHRELGGL